MTTIPTHNNTPAHRFPDFLNDGEWEVKRLGDIAEKVTSKNKSNEQLPVLTNSATEGVVNQQDYFDREIVTRENLTNYHIIELNDFVYNPRISVAAPVGPISRNKIGIGIMSPLYTIFKFKEGNIDFFEQYFRTNCWHQYLKDRANFGARFDRMNISNEDFFNLPIPFPPLAEQCRIAACLSALDEMLAATNGKLEQLKAYKKGLLQKLFPAKGKTLPEFRFKEFENDGEWKEKNLGEVTQCINRRNKSNRALPIYSISNTDGFIPQSEQFAGLDSGSRGYDISLYKIVGKHTFAYNPARINVGSIGYSGDLKDVLISSLYVCFKTSDEMDDSFLMYFFSTSMFKQTVENNVEGGIRSYLFYENFSKIKIAYPTLNEQKKIALCLSSTDDLINTYTNKLLLLQTYKTGLMQQLFP